ncbi:MAG: hypothetical protein GWN07_06305, partial [Actinobacteria bacterium]|nr:hypothetical protein [Actinomycetota bacterium]NIU65104.1 hypothetical protein [Actinomycetota bacterium]NIW26908.1 hypothetical protein [Actinomycetota bacterium]NIX19460.1 hypothetical protein [Actinomycetota bacterium]
TDEEPLVFIVYLDDTSGEVWFVQYAPIDHDNPGDPDEAGDEAGTGFADETLTLSFTAVDGTTVKNTITIEIQDDGPSVTVAAVSEAMLVLDETVGTKAGDPNADDETDADAAVG